MKNIEVVRYKQRLDNLFVQVDALAGNDELRAHLSRYLCILVSGFVEVSVKAIFAKYASDSSVPNVARYVASELEGLTNLKMQKIVDLTACFDDDWRQRLEMKTEGELKEAIDTIVANRNRIAHGDDVGMSYVRIKELYKRVIMVIEEIERICV